MIRNVPANALFFPTNELLKRHYAEVHHLPVDALDVKYNMISGALAGLAYWVGTYPLDIVKVSHRLLCLSWYLLIPLLMLIYIVLLNRHECNVQKVVVDQVGGVLRRRSTNKVDGVPLVVASYPVLCVQSQHVLRCLLPLT